MRTGRLAALLALASALVPSSRALANADANAIAGDHGVDAVVSSSDQAAGGRSHGSTEKSECAWSQVEPDVASISEVQGGYSEAEGAAQPVWVAPHSAGTWYWVDCNWGERYLVFAPAGAPISAARLAQQARKHLQLTAPTMALRPEAGAVHYVNTETWLRVGDWGLRQSSVSVPGVAVTVDAVPVRVEWTIEDGTYDGQGRPNTRKVTCAGPGAQFRDDLPEDRQSTDCGWVWPRASSASPDRKLGITAVVYYRVTWAAVGAPENGQFDDLASEPAAARVRVEEVQTQYRQSP
jgi:hypothetical protein